MGSVEIHTRPERILFLFFLMFFNVKVSRTPLFHTYVKPYEVKLDVP